MVGRRPNVAYFHHKDVGLFYYGRDHPMKPFRLQMANSLVHSYGLHKRPNITVYDTPLASFEDITKFHHPDYVKFLDNSDDLAFKGGRRRRRRRSSGEKEAGDANKVSSPLFDPVETISCYQFF